MKRCFIYKGVNTEHGQGSKWRLVVEVLFAFLQDLGRGKPGRSSGLQTGANSQDAPSCTEAVPSSGQGRAIVELNPDPAVTGSCGSGVWLEGGIIFSPARSEGRQGSGPAKGQGTHTLAQATPLLSSNSFYFRSVRQASGPRPHPAGLPPMFSHPELGWDDVVQGDLLSVHGHTREVGVAQGSGQLLQHQGPLQPGARGPVVPAAAEKPNHTGAGQGAAGRAFPSPTSPPRPSPGAALPQPPWEVLDEGAIAQPVEGMEGGDVAAGDTRQGQRPV